MDLRNWTPDPKDVSTIVLIPDTASTWVGCNLTVVSPTWDTKCKVFVVRPPITVWSSEIYNTFSPVLNLWNVPNPIVDGKEPVSLNQL